MRTCPFCAEKIRNAAVVCKHCGGRVPRPGLVSPALVYVIVVLFILGVAGICWLDKMQGDIQIGEQSLAESEKNAAELRKHRPLPIRLNDPTKKREAGTR